MINKHFSSEEIEQDGKSCLLKNARLGVLGGSGLYSIDSIENIKELDIETPYGKPSDSLRIGNLGGMEVVFLARHGRHHIYTPTEIPYRANIWALRSLNVRWILSPSAVGSLQEQVRPLDMVVPDQFIDRTHQRPLTFFCDGAVAHVTMADPFCPTLSRLLAEEGELLMPEARQVHKGGTYLAMEGPAFSTRAESQLYRSWGCKVIGMTNHTEARLAREAEIAYTSLSMVTDYDCWHEGFGNVSVDLVIENLAANAKLASKIVEATAKRISKLLPPSEAHTALKNSLMTSKDKVSETTREKINLFTENYWGKFNK
ncbi:MULTISPECIES: S-methyl-5'-thioadenosine phosphorylase [Prochlorococcus]|uniref:S-methyl-5'-thioadenosine phosphorylase n=1 Tax=Prochlorococcus marinus (strain SARG / CCMP1375 / SS120) TaxID=167539 RepID=MTAP_PROMA|nr:MULTISPECIES: S-methyl-5'-thioadenosine phosphorylase [Prochlorococcus]Q7VDN6.1 RecName: Full=S-methyl-5'-thioadenosine phosphorylase; AltName: Full=5'-methylthioadenosine phosphorylase; Short=MTA phosphorylase; Short=MTAP [Prochlorococcus marinus subsp. marinus str. CCMP1375]AAP99378.1 Purine nucleoside phosphorylase [Prochlorococcus marinus subsp. marinus str. CCMP1375]KGG11351.1 5'-methylthioadenosine phosphorylase [Prochlorococcus marinus str. LG]KGG18694.1 5'-methylthioadenosine phospho